MTRATEHHARRPELFYLAMLGVAVVVSVVIAATRAPSLPHTTVKEATEVVPAESSTGFEETRANAGSAP
jgi:hypothetical protein